MPISVKSVSAPIYKALADAKKANSIKGKKISHTEAIRISKAMDKALDDGLKRLSPNDVFLKLPYAAGFGVMQSISKKDFANSRDFRKLWDKAADIAATAPDIGNYIPD